MLHNQNSSITSGERFHLDSIKKSNHRRKHYHRSGKKSKSKHRKKIHHHRSSMKTHLSSSSYNTNNINEDQDNQQISFDAQHMVRDHLYISIVGLLCFFPTGIFGLIRAMQANELKRASSLVYWPKLAAIYGRHALRWAILSILIGIMLWTIFIIYHFLRDEHPLWYEISFSMIILKKKF